MLECPPEVDTGRCNRENSAEQIECRACSQQDPQLKLNCGLLRMLRRSLSLTFSSSFFPKQVPYKRLSTVNTGIYPNTHYLLELLT